MRNGVNATDYVLIILYIIIAVGIGVLLTRRIPYLKERYREGNVFLFILTMTILFTGYEGQMLSALLARLLDIFGMNVGAWHITQRVFWVISSILCAVGMWLLVLIDNEDLYDVRLKIRKSRKDGIKNGESSRTDEEI